MCILSFPMSFLILIICVFSPFFFVSLARDLSFLWPFQRNTSWFHWFFSMVFLFSISLIPALMFTVFFLMLALGLFFFTFWRFLRWTGLGFEKIPGCWEGNGRRRIGKWRRTLSHVDFRGVSDAIGRRKGIYLIITKDVAS